MKAFTRAFQKTTDCEVSFSVSRQMGSFNKIKANGADEGQKCRVTAIGHKNGRLNPRYCCFYLAGVIFF